MFVRYLHAYSYSPAIQAERHGFLFKSHRVQLSPQGQAQMAVAGQGPGLSTHHGAEILPESLLCFDSDKSRWKPWASWLFLKAKQHNPALGLTEQTEPAVGIRSNVCTTLTVSILAGLHTWTREGRGGLRGS